MIVVYGILQCLQWIVGIGLEYIVATCKYRDLERAWNRDREASQASIRELLECTARLNEQLSQHATAVGQVQQGLSRTLESGAPCHAAVAEAAAVLHQTTNQLHTDLAAAQTEMTQRSEQLQSGKSARTDALTLLFNQQGFEAEWERIHSAESKAAPSRVLLLADVDQFGKFNQDNGSPAGDQALKGISRALRAKLLGLDVVTARYGGDEIAVLVSGQDLERVQSLAQQIREAVAGIKLPVNASHPAPTISVGCTRAPESSHTAAIGRARAALKAAKSAGGNCCYLHDGQTCVRIGNKASSTAAPSSPPVTTTGGKTKPASPIAHKQQEKRAHLRRNLGGLHPVAPYKDGVPPTEDMFFMARIADISAGGCAILLPEAPTTAALVVALKKANGLIHLAAEVVRVRPADETGEDGQPLVLVACRFTGRVNVEAAPADFACSAT